PAPGREGTTQAPCSCRGEPPACHPCWGRIRRHEGSTLTGALQLRGLPFPCDPPPDGEEPGVERGQVLSQRPAEPAQFRVVLEDAVPRLVEQAEQERPGEQGVEVRGLCRHPLAQQPDGLGPERLVLRLRRRPLPLAPLLTEDGVAEAERR